MRFSKCPSCGYETPIKMYYLKNMTTGQFAGASGYRLSAPRPRFWARRHDAQYRLNRIESGIQKGWAKESDKGDWQIIEIQVDSL